MSAVKSDEVVKNMKIMIVGKYWHCSPIKKFKLQFKYQCLYLNLVFEFTLWLGLF